MVFASRSWSEKWVNTGCLLFKFSSCRRQQSAEGKHGFFSFFTAPTSSDCIAGICNLHSLFLFIFARSFTILYFIDKRRSFCECSNSKVKNIIGDTHDYDALQTHHWDRESSRFCQTEDEFIEDVQSSMNAIDRVEEKRILFLRTIVVFMELMIDYNRFSWWAQLDKEPLWILVEDW